MFCWAEHRYRLIEYMTNAFSFLPILRAKCSAFFCWFAMSMPMSLTFTEWLEEKEKKQQQRKICSLFLYHHFKTKNFRLVCSHCYAVCTLLPSYLFCQFNFCCLKRNETHAPILRRGTTNGKRQPTTSRIEMMMFLLFLL